MSILTIIFYTIILLSSSVIGFLYANTFSKRAKNIMDLEYCIRILETEILAGNTPLPEALNNVYSKGKGDIAQIFYDINQDLLNEKRGDIYDSFLSLEIQLKNNYSFEQEDIETILFLGKILGKTNRLDQEKNFNFIKEQINELAVQANLEKEKNEKLYRSLGVVMGVGIIIILV
ncbi:MAG TPA: stage III sporulation protein AB [Tissierellaceae bacterium]|nr:stage III sporulation protein AB [Tissierellaceae bacterium]